MGGGGAGFSNSALFKKMQLNSPHPVSCSIQFLLPKAGCHGEGKLERSNTKIESQSTPANRTPPDTLTSQPSSYPILFLKFE